MCKAIMIGSDGKRRERREIGGKTQSELNKEVLDGGVKALREGK